MAAFIVKLFPLLAIAITVFAYFVPHSFERLSGMIVPLLGIIMLGMGATLSIQDFVVSLRRPRAVLIGMILQFGVMPLLAFALGHFLRLPQEQLIGLVMVGAVAGGTASNVITYLAGGDVALSITMTACSTLGGIVMTPLLAKLYLQQTVDVPGWAMFQSILYVVAIPVAFGIVLNKWLRKQQRYLLVISPWVSVIGILLVIGIVVALNRTAIRECGLQVLVAVVLHNSGGLGLGYILARLLRCNRRTAITVAIETGMQNSGLAAALSKSFFGVAAALPGAVFSVWHNLSGAIFASLVRRYCAETREQESNSQTDQ